MKNFILSLALILVSIPVFASDWSDEVKVTQIVAGYKEGFILFRTTGSHHNPNDCQNIYSLDPENASVDTALAILLAAQRSDSKVEVGVDPSECGRAGVRYLSGKIKVTRVRGL